MPRTSDDVSLMYCWFCPCSGETMMKLMLCSVVDDHTQRRMDAEYLISRVTMKVQLWIWGVAVGNSGEAQC